MSETPTVEKDRILNALREDAACGHPNHGSPDHDCGPFAAATENDVNRCRQCGTPVRDNYDLCDIAIASAHGALPPAWCLCGFVDDLGDGTCGNCGLPIMTADDDPCARTTEETR